MVPDVHYSIGHTLRGKQIEEPVDWLSERNNAEKFAARAAVTFDEFWNEVYARYRDGKIEVVYVLCNGEPGQSFVLTSTITSIIEESWIQPSSRVSNRVFKREAAGD